jgi:DNA-binding HTH domain-containing proteins
MDSLFNRRCLDVLFAGSVKDFSRQIINFAQDLGFDTVGAMVVTDHSPNLTEFQTLTNAPEGHRGNFHNLEQARVDPVTQHCKRFVSPLSWDRKTYEAAGQQELWDHQAEYGYRSGVAFASHFGRGRHYMFGVNRDQDRSGGAASDRVILEDLLIFGAHSQAAAFDLCSPSQPDSGNSWMLTKGELEALRWTMDGLTNWEIGQKLSLSECDVKLRLTRVTAKLGASTKYEAVLKGHQARPNRGGVIAFCYGHGGHRVTCSAFSSHSFL